MAAAEAGGRPGRPGRPVAVLLAQQLLVATAVVQGWSPDGFPNQLGRAPPRGWRSWIAFQETFTQAKMEEAIDSIHKRRLSGLSLQDVGYGDVGLDDGWANCSGVNGSYHDADGELLVDTKKFPSLTSMTERAHSLGLTIGWYLNCDQCPGSYNNLVESATTRAWYSSDAERAARHSFDGVKLDTQAGGPQWNITEW